MKFPIGIIGDLHTYWDEIDNAQIDQRAYELLLFTGDLGGGTPDSCLRIAQALSRLKSPALVMPGNNDMVDIEKLAAELRYRRGIRRLMTLRRSSTDAEDERPSGARLCGYSNHRFTQNAIDFTVVTGRPHSMGGPELAFPEYMQESWQIESLRASRERLIGLVEATETEQLIFLSHNGPTGLGDRPSDIWGCDFKPGGGDWGDPDLGDAIAHARALGKQVLAVIAGHMHHRTRDGSERPWCVKADDTVYVNPARGPRIFAGEDGPSRHHVAMTISRGGIAVEETFLAST